MSGAPGRSEITGHFAGPATRFAAFAIDWFLAGALLTVALAAASFLLRLVGIELRVGPGGAAWTPTIVAASWTFVYFFVPLAITGRTPGKAVVGLRVVTGDGSPLRAWRALVRVLALPLSLALFGLGLVGIVAGRRRRALHDVLAGSVVVYDWGDRPAELPTPLSRYLAERDALPNP